MDWIIAYGILFLYICGKALMNLTRQSEAEAAYSPKRRR